MKEWKRRLGKNRTAKISLFVLVFITMIAFLAYLIAPDKTERTNRQIPLIALSAPGFGSAFLLEPKSDFNKRKNWIKRFLQGERDHMYYHPCDSLSHQENTVISHYKGLITYHSFVAPGEEQVIYKKFFFGTDKYGRDVLSRIIAGLRVSLLVGFAAVLVSLFIGILIGSIGGYVGGRIDDAIMLLINTAWSIPTILMAFAIIIVLGKGVSVIILAVGLTMWVDIARIVRGQTLQLKNELFIKATTVLGFSTYKTLVKHIIPNMTGIILVMAAANFATAVLVEAGLSFLGLGIQPPTPSLGNMLQESYAYATGGYVYLAIFPILSIMVLVLTFNLLGTALRDVFDIKTTIGK